MVTRTGTRPTVSSLGNQLALGRQNRSTSIELAQEAQSVWIPLSCGRLDANGFCTRFESALHQVQPPGIGHWVVGALFFWREVSLVIFSPAAIVWTPQLFRHQFTRSIHPSAFRFLRGRLVFVGLSSPTGAGLIGLGLLRVAGAPNISSSIPRAVLRLTSSFRLTN